MNAKQSFNHFQLHDDSFFNQEIDAITDVNTQASISNGKRQFGLNTHPLQYQFVLKACSVSALQQTWPEFRMHPDRCADYGITGSIEIHAAF